MKKPVSNKTPFILLAVIHMVFLIYSWRKNNKKDLFTLLYTNIGMAFIFEYFVFILLKAYHYFPRIFKNTTIDDTFGAFLSQAIFVPITATFLTLNNKNWKWKVFFTLYFTSIERIFLHWKLHHNRWWKTRYTTVLIFIYFYLSDYWFKKIGNRLCQFISTNLLVILLHTNLLYLLVLFKQVKFGYNKYNWDEAFQIVPLYGIIQSIIFSINARERNHHSLFFSMIAVLFVDQYFMKGSFIYVKTKYILPFVHCINFLTGYSIYKLVTSTKKQV